MVFFRADIGGGPLCGNFMLVRWPPCCPVMVSAARAGCPRTSGCREVSPAIQGGRHQLHKDKQLKPFHACSAPRKDRTIITISSSLIGSSNRIFEGEMLIM